MSDELLDTTFFIDLRRRDAGALHLWTQIFSGDMAASYSSVTAFELWLGQMAEEEAEFYEDLDEAPLTSNVVRQGGEWVRVLPAEIAERLMRDALIAATAADRNEPVRTRNIRDFRRFPAASVETY